MSETEKEFDRNAAVDGLRKMAAHFTDLAERSRAIADAIEAGEGADALKRKVTSFLKEMEQMYSDLPNASPLDAILEE